MDGNAEKAVTTTNRAADDTTTTNKGKVTQGWKKLLRKDQLTPMEMMQEAAFTELINKESLEQL